MIPNRREYLRRKRLRRRRIFFLCCLVFFIIVAILFGILIHRVWGGSAPTSVPGQEASAPSEISSPEPFSPPAESSAPLALPVSAPDGYELRAMSEEDLHKGSLILINKQHAYSFLDFASPDELGSMYDFMGDAYSLSDAKVAMRPFAAAPLNTMLTDFAKQSGKQDLIIMCGYRTKEESQELFDISEEENGLAHAERYVMKPGYSEHNAALATDIGILQSDGTVSFLINEPPYSWLAENCHKYGFIMRYPIEKADITEIDFESWHFRYLGVPNATAVVKEGLCLEEYIDFIKNYTAEGSHYQVSTADGSYEIYYAPGLQVPVPVGREYEISGNNVDGFIVTMKVS